MKRPRKFTHSINTRFPEEVFKVIKKLEKDKQNEFPRYSESDVVRSAVINHLKAKGYLDKDKNYL